MFCVYCLCERIPAPLSDFILERQRREPLRDREQDEGVFLQIVVSLCPCLHTRVAVDTRCALGLLERLLSDRLFLCDPPQV